MILIVVIIVGLLSWRNTYAYLSSVFEIKGNIITSAASTNPGENLHVVINEVSPVGSSSADWVELYNPTESSVNVSGWTIGDNKGPVTIPAASEIPSGGYAIITTKSPNVPSIPDGVVDIQLNSSTIGGTGGLAVGGDELHLSDGSKVIDEMSWGSDKSVFDASNLTLTSSSTQTIQRIPNGQDTNSASDWKLEPPTMGTANKEGSS